MDTHTRERLQQFAGAANKDILHPLDWQRFFDFVIHVHRTVRPPVPEGEVKDALVVASRFPARNIDSLVSVYRRGDGIYQRGRRF